MGQCMIASRMPTTDRVEDFWRLVYNNNCNTIVMLAGEHSEQQVSRLNVHVCTYRPISNIVLSKSVILK